MILFYLLIGIMPLSQHHIWGRMVGDLTVFKYIGGLCLLHKEVANTCLCNAP